MTARAASWCAKGQRRCLAAVRAGLAAVRVLIELEPDTREDDATGQIERIIDQYGENYHRTAISEASGTVHPSL